MAKARPVRTPRTESLDATLRRSDVMAGRGFGLLLAVSMGTLVTACASLSGGATARFVVDFTCPAERVTTATTVPPPPAPEAPPPEVQTDPERLALWREQQPARQREAAPYLPGDDFYEVSGCGHRVVYGCHHLADLDGIDTSHAECTRVPGGG